jgi:predicted component of type VI protein secretion system
MAITENPNAKGEHQALENTKQIIAIIDRNRFSKSAYKQLVRRIYGNQLKEQTTYSRSQRHKLIKNLGIGTH